MAYWLKMSYERNDYVIDLDRIAVFCHAPSGKVSFHLPDGTPIIINQQSNPEIYRLILDYVEKTTGYSFR